MSDTGDLTPWEEINPPTASAQRRALPSQSSVRTDARKIFRNELTACLALVAPAGMTEESRRDWLTVAWETLNHIPPNILQAGAAAARRLCDHPSKIVPTIIAETAEAIRWQREHPPQLQIAGPRPKKHVMERRGEPMSEEETAELNRILENLGATARYRPDGSRYMLTPC
jgi:hypothetical protein